MRIVRQLPDDPLQFELGKLEVPVPSRRYPAAPILGEQAARQAAAAAEDSGLAEFLRWSYRVDLELPEIEAQDALWLKVFYNEPLAGPELLAAPEPLTLFEALASFSAAWPVLRPHLQALPEEEQAGAPHPAAVIAAIWAQAKAVTRAWARTYGVPDPWAGEQDGAVAAIGAEAPAEREDHYLVEFEHAYEEGQVEVFAQAPRTAEGGCDEAALVWPLIDGKGPKAGSAAAVCDPPRSSCPAAPDEGGCWYSATYDFEPPASGAAELSFEWAPLDVLSLQTARSACWLTRNADLSGDAAIPTNPAFVYRTTEVAFNNPVLPTIVVPRVGPLPPGESLEKTLVEALAPLARAGTGVSSRRLLKLAATHGFALATPAAGEPGREGPGREDQRPERLPCPTATREPTCSSRSSRFCARPRKRRTRRSRRRARQDRAAALMGARGNSGVILSQMIRGACEVIGDHDSSRRRDRRRRAGRRARSRLRLRARAGRGDDAHGHQGCGRGGARILGDADVEPVLQAAAREAHSSVRPHPGPSRRFARGRGR